MTPVNVKPQSDQTNPERSTGYCEVAELAGLVLPQHLGSSLSQGPLFGPQYSTAPL